MRSESNSLFRGRGSSYRKSNPPAELFIRYEASDYGGVFAGYERKRRVERPHCGRCRWTRKEGRTFK